MKHPLHSICPYFAMFPEEFAARQILAYTSPGDLVLDPFCGRGTAVFESLLHDRCSIGTDINPVAACISGAKCDPPTLEETFERLSELEDECKYFEIDTSTQTEFFRACFSTDTLRQVHFLRGQLDWQASAIDRFIAAVALGCLHGESHKTPNCFSNRMPRTISTKPEYSVRWWAERDLLPPRRDVFAILRKFVVFRLSGPMPRLRGRVKLSDARQAGDAFPQLHSQVRLILTSPPYLDTTDFREDQWLRLWFLGGPDRPKSIPESDDRHTNSERYWTFLTEAWKGCAPFVANGSTIVVRIGGTRVPKDVLTRQLLRSLECGFCDLQVHSLSDPQSTEIKNRQTNAFRPGTTASRFEHDFAVELR